MNFRGEKWHLVSGKGPVLTVHKAWGVERDNETGVLYIDRNTLCLQKKKKIT